MSDSYNHIFKQSVNAYHNELISGGSSGGEGALVGARGSIVGIGTDIGGKPCLKVRVPTEIRTDNYVQAQYVYRQVCKDYTDSTPPVVVYLGRSLGKKPRWNRKESANMNIALAST